MIDTIHALARFISENALWIGLIMLIPALIKIGKIIRFLVWEKLFPVSEITVMNKGREVVIDLDSDVPMVTQLRNAEIKARANEITKTK